MRTPRAFTLIELLVVITIIGILAAIALPNYIKAKDKAKEVQAKSGLKSIQVAIERYHTDFEQYPLFLIGGDVEGWKNWHVKYDEPNPSRTMAANAWVIDPLIQYSYVQAYPENPFVDNGNAVIQQTGPVNPGAGYQPGDGDPRFGLRGNTMGNGLDHTMVYTVYPGERFGPSDRETQIVETCRTLKCSTGNQVVAKGFTELLEIDNEDRDDNNGTHWMMGGRRIINSQGEVDTVFTHWPGNFFYRGFPERQALRKGWTIDEPNWYSHLSVSRYLMGVYGSYTTAGVDLIRLEKTDTLGNHIRYRLPGPFGGYQFFMTWWPTAWYRGGMPEVAGGGSESQGPWLPYDGSKEYPGQFIYGCPDGLADGIILVLTAGDEVQAYRE